MIGCVMLASSRLPDRAQPTSRQLDGLLIRARQPDRLDPWLRQAQDSALPAFRGFAKRLRIDEDAVRAAMTSPWSTGQVEGQINRLKMIKRQMYGRANLDLLGRRFLLAA